VVTRNRGGYAAARWLPIRQGLCVPLCAPLPVAVAPIVLEKSGVFPLLSSSQSEMIIPDYAPCRNSHSILVTGTSATFRDWNNALVN